MNELDPKWIRVSSILAMIPSKDSDGKWGYPMHHINQEVLQNKADLGTSVHAAIAAHIKDEFYVVTDQEQPYLDSYLKWEKSIDLKCHDVEVRFYFEQMKLTGCIDMIAKIPPNEMYSLIDFKCTVVPDHVKWPIQGALYELLAHLNGMKLDKKVLFVQLDPSGDYPKVHQYEITPELKTTAISLYNAYMYLTR